MIGNVLSGSTTSNHNPPGIEYVIKLVRHASHQQDGKFRSLLTDSISKGSHFHIETFEDMDLFMIIWIIYLQVSAHYASLYVASKFLYKSL